jgi:hypothetical protein
MNNNRGSFDPIEGTHLRDMVDDAHKTGNTSRIDKLFYEGEPVTIKDSKFIIKHIDHFTGIITLKLLPHKKF